MLIVCEGEKTEPFYFIAIKRKLRLSSAAISIIHPDATDPLTLVQEAEKIVRADTGFDEAYVVFDSDEHDAPVGRMVSFHYITVVYDWRIQSSD